MPANVFFDELAQRWEEEGLFARDEEGHLIRYLRKSQEDYDKVVKLTIDGTEVEVRKATPTKNAQGQVVHVDASGLTIPRASTIYDAVMQLLDQQNKVRREQKESPLAPTVPTLCHLDHLRPVGVCRVCSVAVGKYEKDRKTPSNSKLKFQAKLVPACAHPVENGMVVVTLGYGDNLCCRDKISHEACLNERSKVSGDVRVLLELLAGDHLVELPEKGTPEDKLTDLERLIVQHGEMLGFDHRRFAPHPAPERLPDKSPPPSASVGVSSPLIPSVGDISPLIDVDLSKCILCDRCSRSCTDVKENFVIARAYKGHRAQIAFDLDVPMGKSSCVECGECMLSCPTSALQFREPVEKSDWFLEQVGGVNPVTGQRHVGVPGKSAVKLAEMDKSVLLSVLPWRYRQWNQYSIVRWSVEPGDELCVLGEYGATAFILNSGTFGVWLKDPRAGEKPEKRLARGRPDLGDPDFERDERDVILGEMSCLNHHQRNATVRAITAGEVYEIRRNVLHTLLRNPAARNVLDRVYRERALDNHLRNVPLFKALEAPDRELCRQIISAAMPANPTPAPAELPGKRPAVELIRVEPGQVIFRQGEKADGFYMIRIGYVKVTESFGQEERVVDYLGPDRSFGEIACLSDFPEAIGSLPADFRVEFPGRRTASCSALDDVELVRIDSATFHELVKRVSALRDRLINQANQALSRRQPKRTTGQPIRPANPALQAFTDQGLYNAQRLLVLDLEACTRCDECTKACSDTHGGVTRLIRDGLRFDKWLVASSCRSCSDPYCLVGCPVDAIHRDGSRLEINIEDHCIGCGLCANNCPYGNINMHGAEVKKKGELVFQYRATTCDLCSKIVGRNEDVSCVYACPHDAAFRMGGDELLKRIGK